MKTKYGFTRGFNLLRQGLMLVGAVCLAQISWGADALANLKVQQRYPWNGKVDISFDITSTRTDLGLKLEALDTRTGQSYTVATLKKSDGTTLEYPYRVSKGSNRLVWDAGADLPAGLKSDAFTVSVTVGKAADHPLYAVVDLSSGADATGWPVTYLTDVPEGGWTDEYKTTKMVFRFIQPGTFIQGPNIATAFADGKSRKCTLTKPFYAGVFPVTQKQLRLIMGEDFYSTWLGWFGNYGARYLGDKFPAIKLGQELIRGKFYQDYPTTKEASSESLVGRLREKTGFTGVDMLTEAQWEWACRAGTTTPYYTGDLSLTKDECKEIFGDGLTHEVGCYRPNAWGLYDFCAMEELCAGWYELNYGEDSAIDPEGPTLVESSSPVHLGIPYRAGPECGAWQVNARCFDYEPTMNREGCHAFRLKIQLD